MDHVGQTLVLDRLHPPHQQAHAAVHGKRLISLPQLACDQHIILTDRAAGWAVVHGANVAHLFPQQAARLRHAFVLGEQVACVGQMAGRVECLLLAVFAGAAQPMPF